MTITLYGISNCDTVKKARDWLTANQCEHTFHDFKKNGLTQEQIANWLKAESWEVLVNKKGTTWRNLPDEKKVAVIDTASAMALMLESPNVIKRPVLCKGHTVLIGFSADLYQQQLKALA